jgi:hypothetical protein
MLVAPRRQPASWAPVEASIPRFAGVGVHYRVLHYPVGPLGALKGLLRVFQLGPPEYIEHQVILPMKRGAM